MIRVYLPLGYFIIEDLNTKINADIVRINFSGNIAPSLLPLKHSIENNVWNHPEWKKLNMKLF